MNTNATHDPDGDDKPLDNEAQLKRLRADFDVVVAKIEAKRVVLEARRMRV